jgi:hypothetical protein
MGSLLHQILQCFSLTGRRQVLVAMPSFHAVALLLAALVFTSQHGTFAQCDLQPTISTSGEDGTSNYNDADLVGGVSQINRITTINIYTGCTDVFNSLFIIRQICTTHGLKGKDPEEICHGDKKQQLRRIHCL